MVAVSTAADAARAAFADRGYLFPVRAMPAAEAAAAMERLAAAERATAGMSKADRAHRLFRFKPHLMFPWLDAIVHAPTLLDAVEALVGPDILVWSAALFIKDAHDPAFFSWHQDSYTYRLEGDDLVTAWVALTEVTVANGAMRFLPGSHRAGRIAHEDTFDENSLGSRGERARAAIDDDAAVDVCLAPGEASLHHLHLLHESRANGTATRRVGFAIRYMPPTMVHPDGRASVMLARGAADPERWELEPRPQGEMDDAGRAAFARAAGQRSRETFQGVAAADRLVGPPAA